MAKRMERFMEQALEQAEMAASKGEVPIGAVIVSDGEVIAKAHNLTESTNDPTAHAEVLAIREAAAKKGWARLPSCEMYVTCEPCPMCAGAAVWARLDRIIFGASDPKAGALGSVMDIAASERLNHRVEVTSGVLGTECAKVLSDFFRKRRKEKETQKNETRKLEE